MNERVKWSVLFLVVWGVFATSLPTASAGSRAYRRGQRYYKSYKFSRAVSWLRRALRRSSRLSSKERLQTHLMMAISYYNLTKSKPAASHFRAALKIARGTQVPKGQSPPAVAFFRKVRREYLASHPARRPVRPPARRPGVRVVALTPVPPTKVPKRNAPPWGRRGAFTPPRQPPGSRVAVLTPKRTPPPTGQPSFWRRHRISLITGAVGVVVLGVGVGLGAAFLGAQDALETRKLQANSSGQLLFSMQQDAEALVVPANALLLTGGILVLGAGGIFIAEHLLQRKKSNAQPPPPRRR